MTTNPVALQADTVTAPEDGWLLVHGQAQITSQAVGEASFSVRLRQDGTNLTREHLFIDQNYFSSASLVEMIPVTAGQVTTIQLVIAHESGGSNWYANEDRLVVTFVPADRVDYDLKTTR